YFVCWMWSLWGNKFLRTIINKVRTSRGIATLSSSSSVWDEFFIKINNDSEDSIASNQLMKEAVFIVNKIDNPEKFIAGSMTKASRPFELDKGLVLEDTEQWINSIMNDFDYDIKRTF